MSDPFDLGPLDDTKLAADIQATVPEANIIHHRERWRADLRRRLAGKRPERQLDREED